MIKLPDIEKYRKKAQPTGQPTMSGHVALPSVDAYRKFTANDILGNSGSMTAVDENIVKGMSDAYKSTWTYDLFDTEDSSRKQQGLMPKALEKKYNLDDPADAWLYANAQPYKSKFSKDYQELQQATAEKSQGEETYRQQNVAFRNELFNTMSLEQQQENAAAKLAGREPASVNMERLISKTLAQPQYMDVAENFKRTGSNETDPEGYDLISAMINGTKEKGNTFSEQDLINEFLKRDAMQRSAPGYYARGQQSATARVNTTKADAPELSIERQREAMTQSAIRSAPNATEDELRTMYDAEMNSRRMAGNISEPQTQNRQATAYKTPEERAEFATQMIRQQAEEADRTHLTNEQYRLQQLKSAPSAPDFAQNQNWDTYVENIHSLGTGGIESGQPGGSIFNETLDNSILQMTDEERAIHAYHAAKSKEQAEEYLDAILPELKQRYSQILAERAQGNVGSSVVGGIVSGAANAVEGIGQVASRLAGNTTPRDESTYALTQQELQRLNQGKAAGFAGDLAFTVGNMLPTILVANVTGGASLASSATLGMGAGGNAYAQGRKEGYSDEQSVLYGSLIGASEAGLQSLLGGISKLGGGGLSRLAGKSKTIQGLGQALDGAFTKIIKNPVVLNALKKGGALLGGMNDEGFEEYLQSTLEPVFRNAVFGEENDTLDLLSEDKLYSYLMGAMMGGVFEGANMLTQQADPTQSGGLPTNTAGTQPEVNPLPGNAVVQQQARAAIEQDIQTLGMDPTASNAAMRVYDNLTTRQNVSRKNVRMVEQLKGAVQQAAQTRTEVGADLNVARSETVARLTPLYNAVVAAKQSGNYAGFQQAYAKYLGEYQAAQAKMESEKVKANNQVQNANRKAADTIAQMDADIQEQMEQEAEQALTAQNNAVSPSQTTPAHDIIATQGGAQYGGQGQHEGALYPSLQAELLRTEPGVQPESRRRASEDYGRSAHAISNTRGRESRDEGIRGDHGAQAAAKVSWGLQPTPKAEQSITRHIDNVRQERGYTPNVRITTELDKQNAETLNFVKGITGGRDAFLYESDDDYGDGWTEPHTGDIFVRSNGASEPVFVYGHESAHADPAVVAAGMKVVQNLSIEQLMQYKAYRDARISSDDNADIRRELVADMYGGYIAELGGKQTDTSLGLDKDIKNSFHRAFNDVIKVPALEDASGYTGIGRAARDTAGVEYSRSKPTSITPGMSEQQRYNILKNKPLEIVQYQAAALQGYPTDRMEGMTMREIRPILKDMLKQLGINGNYANADISLNFDYSGKSLRESISKQADLNRQFDEQAKMLTVFPQLAKNAVGIDAYSDKYVGTTRADDNLMGVYVLLSAFQDGSRIVPVEILIKEFADEKSKVHLAITAKEIEAGIFPRTGTASSMPPRSTPTSNTISIADLLENINKTDGNLLKHIPDGFLNDAQSAAKQQAIARDDEKINRLRPEYSRIPFSGSDGQRYSYHMPEIKERKPSAPTVKEYKGHEAATKHIDERTWNDAGMQSTMAFSFEHQQLRPYMVEMAQNFLEDLATGQQGYRYMIEDPVVGAQGFGGVKRRQAKPIVDMLEMGMSYADIEDGLKRIVRGRGQENTANAKHVELMLDEALSKGYKDIKEQKLPPNFEYVEDKSLISGAIENALYGEDDIRFIQEGIKENLTAATIGMDAFYADLTLNGKRMRITGKTKQEVQQKTEAARDETDPDKKRYYADFTIDKKPQHLESDDRAELETQIRDMKQTHAFENTSQEIRETREALQLYNQGTSVTDYYKQGGDSVEVAKTLRGLYLKNGTDQGGMLSEQTLSTLYANMRQWPDPHKLAYTASTPQRIFEKQGNWRHKSIPGAVAMNHLEGEQLKDANWGYVMDQGAKANLWMAEQGRKIQEAFDGNVRTSTLAQMLGEGIITEQQAADALYDAQSMVVQTGEGTFVFNARGELTAMASGDELVLFDEAYRKRKHHMEQKLGRLAAKSDLKISHDEHLRNIRDAEQAFMDKARPVREKGEIRLEKQGNSIRAVTSSGKELANIQNGKRPEMDNVNRLAEALRGFYSQTFHEQNGSLTENGYKPIPYHKGYFPHMKRSAHGLQDFIATLNGDEQALPTEISGRTSTFKPGRPYTSHILERMGELTEYDAVRGFNKYVQAAADLIHYTPAIQRIRQLEKHVREHSGEPGTTKNSAFVSWLHNYGNELANKKSDLDRGLEDMLGREAYTVSDKLTKLFGGSAVAGNISSALSNMISFLSAIPSLEQQQIPGAIHETLRNGMGIMNGEYDGFADKIPFLARRFQGYEKILETDMERAKHKGSQALGFAFQQVDRFAAESAARAKYQELMRKGYLEQDAIKRTSDYLTKIFAERSKGMAPAIFGHKVARPFVQFQLEPLNQLSHFRDMDRQQYVEQIDRIIQENGGVVDGIDWAATENQLKGGGVKGLWRKLYYLILMSLWGMFTREVMGRDQTFNPAGTIMDVVTAAKEDGMSGVAKVLKDTAIDHVPGLSLATGGRIPIASGLENITDIFADDETPLGRAKALGKGALSFIPGGGQLSKTMRGIDAYNKGGSYTDSGRLRFPAEDGLDTFLQAAMFGPNALAPNDFDYQTDTLSNSRTEKYEAMLKKGIDSAAAYGFLQGMDATNTNAGQLVSIVGYDEDEDGKPDFSQQEMNMVAAVLGIKIPAGKSVRQQARSAADDYIARKRKENDITSEQLEEAEDDYDKWLQMMMMGN